MRRKISTLALVLGATAPLVSACSSARAYAQTSKNSDTPFTWSGAVQAGRWVYVRNLNGPVRVEQGTGDKVEVRAEKRWRRGDPEDVKITVRQVGAGGGEIDGATPNVVAHTVNGSIDARSTGGSVTAHTTNGDVMVSSATLGKGGPTLRLSTVNGSIRLRKLS